MVLQRALASGPGSWLVENWYARPVREQLHRSLTNPIQRQYDILTDLIRHGRKTEFGRQHNFGDITTVDEYRDAVPVARYEEMQPYFDRMYYEAEPNVVWPGQVTWFVESSGTTGPKKRLPVTQDGWRRLYLETAKTYIVALSDRLKPRSLLRGKSVFFPGKIHHAEHNPDLLVGDITALNVHLTPWYLDFARAPDKATTLDPDRNWEERLVRIAEATLQQNVVHLAGLPTWLVHFGRIVLEMSGESSLRAVWPNLMAATIGGVNPGPYLPDIDDLFVGNDSDTNPLVYSEVYNGTEGFYAMQIDDGDMVLLPDGGLYYEFVENDAAMAGDFTRAVSLEEVQVGMGYAPVISTYCGLWRYLIGDTIRFTARNPYRLKVTGRINQFLNIAGEELLVANVDDALERVRAALGVSLLDYTGVALKLHGEGEGACHLWLVALQDTGGAAGKMTGPSFAAALDRELVQNHFDYAKMRNQGASGQRAFGLGAPIVLLLPPDSFVRWLNHRLGGNTGGQSKAPRLSQDGRMAADVLCMLEPGVLERLLEPYPALDADKLLRLLSQ